MLYFRVRRVSYLPSDPNHLIYGDWYNGSTAVVNQNDHENWQQVITFAEDGKNKKVLTFYDGTLRPVQTMTNLNHEESTLISESKYDYEGRKVLDFLPFVTEGWSPVYSERNTFNSKSHYDNGSTMNVEPSVNTADKYYSNHKDPSVPRANGFTYSQTVFSGDNTNRVKTQSGIGEKFSIDGNNNTKYFYGSATRQELVRLFGPINIGDENHYKKVLSLDPNKQVSVTYLDPLGRIIATALAGDPPASLEALESVPENDPIPVDLSNFYTEDENWNRTTYYKILNTNPITYDFNYLLSPTGDIIEDDGTCITCQFDLILQVLKPDGGVLFEFEQNDFSINCGNSSLDPVIDPLLFDEIGEYTVIKKLNLHRPTYEEALEIVSRDLEVIQDVALIEYNEPSIDDELCTIDFEEYDYEGLLEIFEPLALDVVLNTCNEIKNELIIELQALIPDKSFAELEANFDEEIRDAGLAGDSRYCEFQFCTQNVDSDVFDATLFLIDSWPQASNLEIIDLLALDDFFNDPNLSGSQRNYKSLMQGFIDNYILTSIDLDNPNNNRDFKGSIEEIVNPLSLNMWAENLRAETHFLYAGIIEQSLEDEISVINQLRWRNYRSFYLEAKNRVKIQIAEDELCSSLKETLEQRDPDTYLGPDGILTSEEILSYGDEGYTFLGDISEEELDIKMAQI